jgi:hypothetical protein
MLAQLDSRLPSGQQWRYEPKLDGFRGLLWHRSTGQAQLLSRNTRDLGQWFPELMRAARTLPPDTLVDGEIVICDDSGRVDFGALQARLGTARNTVATVALERPAVLVVFDVLWLEAVPEGNTAHSTPSTFASCERTGKCACPNSGASPARGPITTFTAGGASALPSTLPCPVRRRA